MAITASEMAKRRAAKLGPKRRSEIAKKGGAAFRENARQRMIQRHLWTRILEGVDTLFARIKADGKQRALFVHMGDVIVMATDSADYRILAAKHPNSLVGVFNHRSTRKQVFDDIHEVTGRLTQAFKN